MIANGYYDLATPFFATEYTVNHIGLEPALEQSHQLDVLRRRAYAVHQEKLSGRVARSDGGFLSEGASDSVRYRMRAMQ